VLLVGGVERAGLVRDVAGRPTPHLAADADVLDVGALVEALADALVGDEVAVPEVHEQLLLGGLVGQDHAVEGQLGGEAEAQGPLHQADFLLPEGPQQVAAVLEALRHRLERDEVVGEAARGVGAPVRVGGMPSPA
jgi:hypothetical protein